MKERERESLAQGVDVYWSVNDELQWRVNASINLLRFWTKLKLELQHAFGALFMRYRGSPTILPRYKSKVFENGQKRETLIQRIPKEYSRLDCLERKGKTKYK
jgi:hypothetical protein